MKYFDETEPCEVPVDKRDRLLITHHGQSTSWPNFQFSIRNWYYDQRKPGAPLSPGKGVTIPVQDVTDFVEVVMEAFVKAEFTGTMTLIQSTEAFLEYLQLHTED